MYGTKAAFDYIVVGGRCAYETNKIFEFPVQPFSAINSLYVTEHDGIRCDFMDTTSYLEVLFDQIIDSNDFYMLHLIYYAKNVTNLNLKITWKKKDAIEFCDLCYENVVLEISEDKFLHANIDLRQNSEWMGEITTLRVCIYNTKIVPLFIKYFSVYSPTVYRCVNSLCPYYGKYNHPCDGGKDLHIIIGKYLDGNNIELVSESSFLFTIYGVDFVINFESNHYFLDIILSKLNTFFDSMPIPCLKAVKDSGKIKLSCDYTKPVIKYTELSKKLGFFNNNGSESVVYTIENSGKSNYIDVAGNLKGIYEVSNLGNLDFGKVFSVGFSDTKDFYPNSSFEFFNQTVIFYTLAVSFDGYLNCFEIYCKIFSGGGKILIYRRNGDIYEVVDSYSLTETTSMSKHVIDWNCKVYKGDIIGVYNLELSISKRTTGPINYYGLVSGYSDSINKTNLENISFSSVSIYACLKQLLANDIPIVAFYNEVSYVDKLSFLLEYGNSDKNYFNVIFDNTFNYEIAGCQINVKSTQDIVTEIPGEISDIECLSDNVFSYTNNKIQMGHDSAPPIDLSTIDGKDALKYSWDKYIIDIYERNGCSYTFIPGSVFFYYEFPSIIDICRVFIVSAEEEMLDGYLLKALDNTKMFPTFSNAADVVVLDSQINNRQFIIENNETKGIGIFVYNYEELPNINFSEIVIYTEIGSIPEYIIEIIGVTYDDYKVSFNSNVTGYKNDVYLGCHVKSLIINVNFITSNQFLNFKDINIYSSYLPDDYFVSGSESGEGILTIYNTKLKTLECCLLDYNVNLLDNLVYEYDFDNGVLHKGFIPTQCTHSQFYFISTDYKNNKYVTYSLNNMLNLEAFFVTKLYYFNLQEYDDWYTPYDYIISGYDGKFAYIDGGLKLKPLTNEALRWFNYININEFYNDIDIELKFDYVGNVEDFVFIGLTCCDRDYNNYLKFYAVFQTSPEYGLEFQLEGDLDPTYYKFSATLGRSVGLKIKKRGDSWTFYCFYGDNWHELTTFSLFDTEILIAVSTLFDAPHVKDNVIAEFKLCEIKASKIISGKKVWYTINDGLDYIYSGNVLDDSTILDNINKSLTFSRDYTVKKFVYSFNAISCKYLKFVSVSDKSIKITEIKCYINDVLVPIKQGYVSYSGDLFFGTLDGETSCLDDNIIINYELSDTICKGGDTVLSSVGVEFNDNVGINKAVLYYIEETGSYEPCKLLYSYDNFIYFNVYDNFSLFSKNQNTTLYCLFNEFSGYKGKNEVVYELVSNNQYSTDFSEEGVLDYKWTVSSSYEVDSGGIWLKHLTGAEGLYSKFSIDGDFIIDTYFDSLSNCSGGEASIILKVIFKNNTFYNNVYIKQRFDNHYVYTRNDGYGMESGRTSGRLRIKRIGSTFYFYYRKYGTTWYEVGSHNYGGDYVYPVDINVYLSGDNSFDLRINKILITEGIGISDTDFELLETPSISTLFVRGRQFSDNDTYALATRWSMTELFYPFSFSLLHSVISSIPIGSFLVEKPYSFYFTYENKDLSLLWFSEYFVKFKINDVLSYSSDINTISSVSIGDYNVNKNLFTDISDSSLKAVYKSRYDVNMLIDESFKAGEGTFNREYTSPTCQPGYLFDNFTNNDGAKANSIYWATYDTKFRGTVRILNNKLYFCFTDTIVCNPNDKNSHIGLSSDCLTATIVSPGDSGKALRCTEAISSGKWYWETYMVNIDGGNCHVGIATKEADLTTILGYEIYSWSYRQHGDLFHPGDYYHWNYDFYTGYVIGVALDMDSGKLWYSRNGVWLDSGDPVAGTNEAFDGITGKIYPALGLGYTPASMRMRFDSSSWSYTPPEGFGELKIFAPEYVSLRSIYNFSGDFDVQIDFTVCSGIDSSGWGIDLLFEIGDANIDSKGIGATDNRVYLRVGYDFGNIFTCEAVIDGVSNCFNSIRINNYGKLRMVRTVNVITTYYKDGDEANWTEFRVFSSFSIDIGKIILGFYSATSPNLFGYFDNFTLVTDNKFDCRPRVLSDSFTGIDGSYANVEDWVTYDTGKGNVRIKNNKLYFSFST